MVAAPGSALSEQDRDFCRGALTYYEQIARRYRDDLEMGRIAAAAEHRVGFIRMILRDADAEGPYRRSIALYESILAGTGADPELRVDLHTALYDQALLFRETRRVPEALDCLRKLIALQQGLADDYPSSKTYAISLSYHQAFLMEMIEAAGLDPRAEEARSELARATPRR